MMEWKQFVFGKLIQYPDGPIIPGFEHGCTGKTQQLPAALSSLLSPSHIGPGISDLTDWGKYPWIKKGGLAVEYVIIDGVPWMVVCRARGRSEKGEGKPGRWYTQAHYLVLRLSSFSAIALCSIFEYAQAMPMMERDLSLPCMSATITKKELREDWISYIAPILRHILSGIPFAISSSKGSMESLEELAHLLYVSLPDSISWKLTVRLGADVLSEGDAVFGVAHKVMSGPRMIGFSLGDSDHKTRAVEHAQKHPIHTDHLIGDRYVDFLYEKASSCTTDQELQEILRTEFPHMTWDYFPLQTTFSQAGLLLMRDIYERDLINSFDDEQSNFPEPTHFQVYRKEALCAAVPYLLDRAASFIAHSITLWPDIWREISKSTVPCKPLLVFGEAWTMSLLFDHPVLPNALVSIVEHVLMRQMERDDTFIFWKEVFRCWERTPAWFQKLCLKHESLIFWNMVHRVHIHDRFEDLLLCEKLPSGKFFARCVQGEEIHQEEIQSWLSHASHLDDLSWLCSQLLKKDVHNTCAILSWTKKDLPIHKDFMPMGILKSPNRGEMVQAILEQPNRYSIISDQILLVESVFEGAQKDRIIERLSERLDPILGHLLWGISTNGNGYDQPFVYSLIQLLLSSGYEERLLLHLYQNSDISSVLSARDLFIRALAVESSLNMEESNITIVYHLLHGHDEPSVLEVDETRLTFLIEGMPQKDWSRQLKTAQVLRCFILAQQKVHAIDTALLEVLLQENKERWSNLLLSYRYRTEPVWKIVSHYFDPQEPIFLTEEETVIVQQCSQATKLLLFCSGIIFDDSFSHSAPMEERMLASGLWVSMHAPESKIQIFLLQNALSFLSQEEVLILKKKYATTGIWGAFIHWIQSFQSYHVPELFPYKWTIFKFCQVILERLPQSVRRQVFTSS